MEVVSNRFWLCLIVFGFKTFRTGRDFLLGFLVRPCGALSMPPAMQVVFYVARQYNAINRKGLNTFYSRLVM